VTTVQYALNDYISNRLEEIEDMVGYVPSLVNIDENNVSYREEGDLMLYYLAGECDTLDVMRGIVGKSLEQK
jgi:hypothetical protein